MIFTVTYGDINSMVTIYGGVQLLHIDIVGKTLLVKDTRDGIGEGIYTIPLPREKDTKIVKKGLVSIRS